MKQLTNGASKEHNGLILAIDGGATNCRAVLCTQEGYVLGSGQSGSCNYQNVGLTTAIGHLEDAITQACGSARRQHKLKAAVFGLAGLDTRQDYRTVSTAIEQLLTQLGIDCENIYIDNDGMITLLGAIGYEDGVLVIAGTGSIACGITKLGKQVRAGGWGQLLDDAGSGYAIGRAALSHVMSAYDGRETESKIVATVLNLLTLTDPEQLVNWVYSSECTVDEIAALAPAVCNLAELGDWKALDILADAGQSLQRLTLAVVDRLGLRNSPFQLMLSGGVLRKNRIFREQLSEAIKQECPQVKLVDAQFPPICGGVLRAFRDTDIDHRQVLMRLNKQLLDIK